MLPIVEAVPAKGARPYRASKPHRGSIEPAPSPAPRRDAIIADALRRDELARRKRPGSCGTAPHMFKLLCRPAGILASLTRAASKKAAGSGGVSRTSNPKFLGVKIFGDQFAKAGATVIRQRGVRYSPGENMGLARDSKLFALKSGYVEFQKTWLPKKRHLVHIRERTPEEHLAFVRGKKPAREAAARLNPSPHAKLQMGLFAHRGEPRRTQPDASSTVSG